MKTCFVISPIGKENSEIRKHADDLFELIIEPALEKYDFEVIRGDMEASVSSITDDIIKRIQNAELCVIDLTGRNPNVFYECGRRHETAKPFILMIKKDEEIPFDLKDIRTVEYDLTDPRTTRKSVDKLRFYVNEFEQAGYGSESSVASLTSIASTLTRIERKIDGIGIVGSQGPSTIDPASFSGSPVLVFYDALKVNDYPTAVNALKRFMMISHDINLHLDLASMLVEAYEPMGVPIVQTILDKDFDRLDSSKLSIALHALYTFFVGALTIENEAKYLTEQAKKALQKSNITDKEKAALYNVLASVEYSLKNTPESLKYQEKTVDLNPSEPAYYYNISTLYKSLDMQEEMVKSLNMLIAIYKNKDPKKEKINLKYLDYARKILAARNQVDKINEIDEIVNNAKKYPENISLTI